MSDNAALYSATNADTVNRVALKMKEYHHSNQKKVQHFVRVYTLSKTIGELEHLSDSDRFDTELAALTHSVEGDKTAEVKGILKTCGIADETALRVCHIVENCENYDHVSTLSHQILIEAKLIVDFKEKNVPINEIIRKAEDIFITNSGKLFLKRAFNI